MPELETKSVEHEEEKGTESESENDPEGEEEPENTEGEGEGEEGEGEGEGEAKIPRARLNEELEKRHALEEEVRTLKEQAGRVSTPEKKENIYEVGIAKLKAKGYDQDDIDTILNIADTITQTRLSQTQESTGEIIRNLTVDKITKDNAIAKKYEKELQDLTKKIPSKYLNPQLIEMKCYEFLGRKMSNGDALKEAEMKGKKKAVEQKKIVTKAGAEGAGVPSGKVKKPILSDAEKSVARKMGISEEDYLKHK